MKTGRSLQEIAAELERQRDTRKDYIAPQGAVDVKVVNGEVALDGINHNPLALTANAHDQFSDHLEIPRKYYDRMRATQPDLLAANIRTWLHAKPEERRMLRTLDGKVRAFVSPKFRPLDNYDLAAAVMPELHRVNAKVVSAELTERRLYIKAILPSLSDELPEGLVWGAGHHIFGPTDRKIVAAIVIANSDVGAGTLRVEPSVYAAYCTNLAVMVEAAMRKYHVGRSFEADANFEVFRDETRRQADRAFFMQVRDVAMAAFSEDRFRAAIAMIRAAADKKIVSDDLPKVVDVTIEELGLPEATKSGVLTWLARGGDLSQWGLSSAITRASQDVDDYEVATAMERAGGQVLALKDAEWEEIAEAA